MAFESQPLDSQPGDLTEPSAEPLESQPLDSQPRGLTVLDDPCQPSDEPWESQPLDSQPRGLTVLDDPYPESEDSQDDVMVVEEQVAHLPAEHVCKKQKLDEPVPVAKCLDQIKWVGSVPFVLSHGSQKIHCGRSVMCRTKVGDLTVVHCLTNCCILGGHPDGQNCGCFCHLLAKSYQYQWPPTSIEG